MKKFSSRKPRSGIALAAFLMVSMIALPSHARSPFDDIDAKLDILIDAVVGGTSSEPISLSVFEFVEDSGSRHTQDLFVVPEGKILFVDHASVFLDVVVRNRPTADIRILASLVGTGVSETPTRVTFQLGYMDEFPQTSRGTPNFIAQGELGVFFGPGPVQCESNTRFGGVNLDFGTASCTFSGRLVDAP
jgi:hypothetical protein